MDAMDAIAMTVHTPCFRHRKIKHDRGNTYLSIFGPQFINYGDVKKCQTNKWNQRSENTVDGNAVSIVIEWILDQIRLSDNDTREIGCHVHLDGLGPLFGSPGNFMALVRNVGQRIVEMLVK